MPTLVSESGVLALYQEAVETLLRGLKADRGAIFYLGSDGELKLGGVIGLAPFPMNDCPFSVSLLQDVLRRGHNVLYSNVAKDAQAAGNVSLQLSGAVSLLCVPFYDETDRPAGVLYADTCARLQAFGQQQLLFARDCGNWLECCLAGRDNLPKPEVEESRERSKPELTEAPREAVPVRRPKRGGPAAAVSRAKVPSQELMVFLRSLSTLIGAGVPIHSALFTLAEGQQTQVLGKVSSDLALLVSRGEPLSAAMERYPTIFGVAIRATVRVGERTGSLVHVMNVLATDLEKGHRLFQRIRAALTYPAILAVACAALLFWGPPYLLQGHLKMLADSGMSLPFLTRCLLGLSQFSRSPIVLVGAACLALGFWNFSRSDSGRLKLRRLFSKLPAVGPFLKLLDRTLFVRALSLQLRAGLTVAESLALGRQSCQDPGLAHGLRRAELALRDGHTFTQALAQCGEFDPVFLSFIDAGESVGRLETLTGWLADLYERDLETRMDGLVVLAEPLIMAVMGAVGALLMIATLKPTLLLLQTL